MPFIAISHCIIISKSVIISDNDYLLSIEEWTGINMLLLILLPKNRFDDSFVASIYSMQILITKMKLDHYSSLSNKIIVLDNNKSFLSIKFTI